MNKNNSKISQIAKKVLGVILIVLGIIGLFLPFLQGWLMIIVGSSLLGSRYIFKLLVKTKKFLRDFFSLK